MVAKNAARRAYHSPLRERQAAGTRHEILEAVAELIVSEGVMDFSMRDVATHAGVSERTVYYHFPSRQEILDGLMQWVGDQLEERLLRSDPRESGDVAGRIREIFTAFDEIGAPARAMARLSAAQGIRPAEYHERTTAFRERFAEVLDRLPPAEAERCFAMLRHIASATTWITLRDEFALGGEDAAQTVAWALETLLADLRERGGKTRA